MAFVLGDQFSRANLLPVNHPPLSSFPPAPSPSPALSDGSPLTGCSAGTRPCMQLWPMGAVSLSSLSIRLSFPSPLKKYSLISNGDFTEHHWFSLTFLADKEEEEEEVEEKRKPSGQAW